MAFENVIYRLLGIHTNPSPRRYWINVYLTRILGWAVTLGGSLSFFLIERLKAGLLALINNLDAELQSLGSSEDAALWQETAIEFLQIQRDLIDSLSILPTITLVLVGLLCVLSSYFYQRIYELGAANRN